jgi:hypothetical protein
MKFTKRTLMGLVSATLLSAAPFQAFAQDWQPRKPMW